MKDVKVAHVFCEHFMRLRGVNRRRFLGKTMQAAGVVAFGRAPAIIRQAAARPGIPSGTAIGDVVAGRALIWSRSDRPARMRVDWSTTESFQNPRRASGAMAVARANTGFTARVDLADIPPGQTIFYRVFFEDLADSGNLGEPAGGRFLSVPGPARDVTFAWSADVVGQGWGINREWGGLRMFETIRRAQPDFFIHCGDTIYADGPVPAEQKLPDGSIWKNLVTPAKSKVAETLDEFRGNYLYNLLDDHARRFNAEVPQIVLWDDHEVKNNWYPTMDLKADPRYTITDPAVLIGNARRAFLEHQPIRLAPGERPPIFRSVPYGPLLEVFALDLRTYRGPNSPNRQPVASAATTLAGAAQIQWLKRALAASKATWKVIASDMPIGLIVPDAGIGFEAFANGDGPPLGRELELADLLGFIAAQKIQNVVWVTADVHYAAAHHYAPERAQFKGFRPFWEFVAGPLHAATGPPSALDNTFGPEVRFVSVPPGTAYPGPAAGLQFFGMMSIGAATKIMTVRLHNLRGDTIYSVDLNPSA
jgi:alkaline phosphatase D